MDSRRGALFAVLLLHAMLLTSVGAESNATALVSVWPRPRHIDVKEYAKALQLDTDEIDVILNVGGSEQLVTDALERALDNIALFCALPHRMDIFNPIPELEISALITQITISVDDADAELSIGVDESYQLTVEEDDDGGDGHVTIEAATLWGALRGIETLSQLPQLHATNAGGVCAVPYTSAVIRDQPRFSWRGLLLDTARHYLEIDTVLAMIDAMAYNKMNVFHWHITDAESFSFGSEAHPELPQEGAYSPDAVYTIDDINSIISYAHDRGVLVMPEVDVPGHTASWGQSHPENIADCWDMLRDKYGGIYWPSWNEVAMNPSVNSTFDLVNDVVQEIAEVFQSEFLHMGGDEVSFDCWAAVPSINEWMEQQGYVDKDGLPDYVAVQSMFEDRVQEMVVAQGKRTVLWEEAFTNSDGLDPTTVVNVWIDPTTATSALQAGLDTVMSFGWYLDKEAPTCMDSLCPVNWMWTWTWHDMYGMEPADYIPSNGTGTLLGGEASYWGESADDTNAQNMVWGRAPAVSERLWSSQNVTDIQDAQNRIAVFACKLKRRGINTAPTEPDYCPMPANNDDDDDDDDDTSSSNDMEWAMITLTIVSGLFAIAAVFIAAVLFLQLRRAGACGGEVLDHEEHSPLAD